MPSSIRRSNVSSPATDGSVSVSISTILKDLPILRLRKDIWEQFPVCLEKLELSADGRDRYYVRWHRKNLATWSQGISQYSAIAKIRLIRALNANKNDWIIKDSPVEENAICLLEMALPNERAIPIPQNYLNALNDAIPGPDIETLEDIRDNFPVCWTMQPDGGALLSYHDRQVQKLAELMQCPVDEIRGRVHEKLLTGLWNGGWIIDASAVGPNTLGTVCKSDCSRIEI